MLRRRELAPAIRGAAAPDRRSHLRPAAANDWDLPNRALRGSGVERALHSRGNPAAPACAAAVPAHLIAEQKARIKEIEGVGTAHRILGCG